MFHLRIIGALWICTCLISAVSLPVQLWSRATDARLPSEGTGFWIGQILAEFSFLTVVAIGIGMIALKDWALRANSYLAVIVSAVCLWFISTQGMQHAIEPYVGCCFGLAFALWALFAGRRSAWNKART